MALDISKPGNEPVSLDEFAPAVASRREELGMTDLPRNRGKRRTESKRAFLAAIEVAGKVW